MGGNLSFTASPEDIIEDIDNSDKFIEYQDKFEDLTPSRNLFFDEKELVIESKTNNSYSITRYEFEWSRKDVEDQIYGCLDRLYAAYKHTEKMGSGVESYTETDDPDESYTETETSDGSYTETETSDGSNSETSESNETDKSERTRQEIIEYIRNSVNSDVEGWLPWLNAHFDPDSLGYQLFTMMEESTPSKANRVGGITIYPPQSIWFNILEKMVESGIIGVRSSIKDRVRELYDEAYDILNEDNNIVVIIANTGDGWKYVGLTTEIVENIYDTYNYQTY